LSRPDGEIKVNNRSSRLVAIVTTVLLLLILTGAAYARLWHLTPPQVGIHYAPDTDEGAYAFSAQLMLQGNWPYRDFFATLPPAGLYLFSAVLGIFYHLWGSLEGFMALRYMSVAYGVATVLVVYFIGRELGGRPAGLLAALVLAVDGVVIGQDRRAMLEAPMNLLSALAVLVYLRAMLREGVSRRSMLVAGALSAAAVMVKSPGAVTPILLVGMTVLRRRWRDLWALIAGGVVTGLILVGPFLVCCPEEFVKQVYVFQFVRPPDGVLAVEDRLREIWGYPYSWLTMRLCWLGAAAALALHWRKRTWSGWMLAALWAGGTLGLIIASRSYWGTYFPQLAVPLAILAGGLLSGGIVAPAGPRRRIVWEGAPALILLVFLAWGIGFDHFGVQYRSTRVWLSFSKPAFGAVAQYLGTHSNPDDTVLATDPLYGMLASRALAHEDEWPYMADSYGSMLYAGLGLQDTPWGEVSDLKAQIDDEFVAHEDLATLRFHRVEAQADVMASFATARYAVIDRRARRQWAPATIAHIEENAVVRLTLDDVTLLERVVQ
jgi:hypothetical protein